MIEWSEKKVVEKEVGFKSPDIKICFEKFPIVTTVWPSSPPILQQACELERRDVRYAQWQVVITIQFFAGPRPAINTTPPQYPFFNRWQCNGNFFGGPSARHQYNGTTISFVNRRQCNGNFWLGLLPAINTLATQLPCPVLSAQSPVSFD